MTGPPPPSVGELRERFDAAAPYTVGIEDEVMLLSPDTLELAPRAPEVLALLDGDDRFKLELPASQLEIVVGPSSRVRDAANALWAARRHLAERCRDEVALCAAGAHPSSPGIGELNPGGRYDRIRTLYGRVAQRQLVCALQVHVAVGDADRTLALYNAARSYLPMLAALAANAPFYEGRDTGLASVRPLLCRLLPRQGIPPSIASWDEYAAILTAVDPSMWWWELRLHPLFGTLEFRVPDGQSTVADAAAIAAVIQALASWLGARHDGGERLPVAPSWRIEQNRFSACRHGLEGTMIDIHTGHELPTHAALEQLLMELNLGEFRPAAEAMLQCNGAMAQRATGSAPEAVRWLAGRFLDPPRG